MTLTSSSPLFDDRPETSLVVRPAAERFHSRLDWLDSWHSFSFSHHHDPAWMGFGPLRVINDDTIAAGRGFGMHPHRDMEIVTVMVEGQLNHRDSMGHSEVLREGEVQAMSAGTGVVHSEMNLGERACRLLQIWIEPSRDGFPPAYRQEPFQLQADWTPLLDPDGERGALAINRPIRLWRARPAAGDRLALGIASDARGWLQLIDGQGTAFGRPLERGDGVGFPAGPGETFEAGENGADLLLFELR
ncbi:pirin-like bicupin family protein [Synechococcus sp. CCY 9618]|uniref:pirin family protein n=1 Tax=Synechococcus sp. CCY 9618 TaxID=2815602 RepID=UPI001C2119B3|nr:pirin-like bicupin family protein [Synechococcus sp. CCY 9618]